MNWTEMYVDRNGFLFWSQLVFQKVNVTSGKLSPGEAFCEIHIYLPVPLLGSKDQCDLPTKVRLYYLKVGFCSVLNKFHQRKFILKLILSSDIPRAYWPSMKKWPAELNPGGYGRPVPDRDRRAAHLHRRPRRGPGRKLPEMSAMIDPLSFSLSCLFRDFFCEKLV